MKACLSSVIAVVCFLSLLFSSSGALQAADVDVTLEFSTDGSTWNTVTSSIEGISGPEASVRTLIGPTGETPLAGPPVTVDLPTNAGEVLVSLESSPDLTSWSKATPGTISVSDKTFFRANSIGFSLIPAGTFQMGSPESELGREPIEANETQHEVTLTRAFYMQQTEVTWDQWSEVRAWAVANGYLLSSGIKGTGGAATGSHPVTEINWNDAVKWLNALSEREGLTPCYTVGGATYKSGNTIPDCDFTADGYRLPTEAEWEYACRAGSTTAFYSGPITQTGTSPVDPNLDLIGWYGGNSGGVTHPVGLKQPNAWGLYDMSGNVLEWCWDRYQAVYEIPSEDDPIGPSTGSNRVSRGGYWGTISEGARSAFRLSLVPDSSGYSNTVGIRPVRTVVLP